MIDLELVGGQKVTAMPDQIAKITDAGDGVLKVTFFGPEMLVTVSPNILALKADLEKGALEVKEPQDAAAALQAPASADFEIPPAAPAEGAAPVSP